MDPKMDKAMTQSCEWRMTVFYCEKRRSPASCGEENQGPAFVSTSLQNWNSAYLIAIFGVVNYYLSQQLDCTCENQYRSPMEDAKRAGESRPSASWAFQTAWQLGLNMGKNTSRSMRKECYEDRKREKERER